MGHRLEVCCRDLYNQSVHHFYSPYPDCTPNIQSMFSQYIIRFFIAHVQSVHHLYCPYTARIPPLLHISSQNTTSTVYVQSEYRIYAYFQLVHYLFSPWPLIKTSHLPKLSQYYISLSHIQPEYYLYCPCPVKISHLLPMSSLAYHLSCPCPVSTLYLLHISSQNITSKYWLHPV